MRPAVVWLLVFAALAYAEQSDEPWVEEEDVEEPYNEEPEDDPHYRRRREAYVEDPLEEHIRVKRKCNCDDEPVGRVRRSPAYVRNPRQVHQYEVHEFHDEGSAPVLPYEEMLAASAEHYHRVVAAPGAPASARYLNADVSAGQVPLSVVQFHPPHNPVQFAPAKAAPLNIAPIPLSVGSPVAVAHAPVVGPLPVPSVAVPQLKQLSDGDLYGSAAGHHHKHHDHHDHSHGHTHGGGYDGDGHHYNEHGGKGTKGSKSHHHVDRGNKGYKTNEHHRKEYEEAEGKKKKHHDNADHKGSHEEEAYGSRGAHFGEKKGHKKGHKSKGYHNKYHKDEFHKEHKFYDDFHKGGEHHRFGKFNAKHASNESGKKKAHHVRAGHDFIERGKKGYSNKGHMDADHNGYQGKDGHEEHHEHHSEHGKKGGHEGGKQWGFGHKN